MAISKIILNGVTQMDLTSDTVAANNLISPNTAHDAAGLPVVGTATAGMDIPIFTITYDSNWEEILSVTCDETFAEVVSHWSAGDVLIATEIETNGTETYSLSYAGVITQGSSNSVTYTFYLNAQPYIDITYSNNGQIFVVQPSEFAETLNATSNGTYYPQNGVYTVANVTVPSGSPNLQAKTNIAPTTSSQTITADSGYDGLSSVQINAMPTGTAGTPTAIKGAVSNHAISVTPSVTNTTGYISGGTHSGTAVTVSASELVSGTYTVDSSGTKDMTNYASASVPAGTAGTPSATKGAVSNHQVSVTPSVTNVTGWITGSTKNGTAVTVTASELASGNKAIVDNGTNIDVVGYSTVSVAVPFSAITVSSSNPTGGNNGDIWIKTS